MALVTSRQRRAAARGGIRPTLICENLLRGLEASRTGTVAINSQGIDGVIAP